MLGYETRWRFINIQYNFTADASFLRPLDFHTHTHSPWHSREERKGLRFYGSWKKRFPRCIFTTCLWVLEEKGEKVKWKALQILDFLNFRWSFSWELFISVWKLKKFPSLECTRSLFFSPVEGCHGWRRSWRNISYEIDMNESLTYWRFWGKRIESFFGNLKIHTWQGC